MDVGVVTSLEGVTCDGSDKCPSYSVNISGFASFVVAGRRLSGAMRNFC